MASDVAAIDALLDLCEFGAPSYPDAVRAGGMDGPTVAGVAERDGVARRADAIAGKFAGAKLRFRDPARPGAAAGP
jgi:5-aminolevulinate synthase